VSICLKGLRARPALDPGDAADLAPPMNVLIADDEPMTRSLLRRVLTRECGCTVSEVADGLAALSSCGSTPPDLLITDLRMPLMDGIELIEALKQVPALAAIPVVMMTAAREQGPVHRAIELGVTDYLLKPLQADRVGERLRHVVERVMRANDPNAEDERSPVLVADGSAEFRQFVVSALGTLRVVHQAPTGVAALQRAVETRPGIVLIGEELGLLGPDLLMRKLRAASELAGTRIVALVPKGAGTAIPEQADAVLVRTSVAEQMRRQLSALGGPGRKASKVLARHPSLRAELASAAAQVLGTMLKLEVQHTYEIQPRPAPQMVVASLAIDLPDAAEVVTMTLRTDLGSAAKLAAGTADDAAALTDEAGALAAAASALGAIGGRIKTTLEASGARVEMQSPASQIMPAGDLSEGAAGRVQVTAHAAEGGLQFVLQLISAPAVAAGGASTAEPAPVAAAVS